ncbi:hypothetical protein B296_00003369 [Ensete ventricosum]|uniref:Uncharacterized protein n=1 Tax=Ensete ventricosum TaxID=4639 RepID=A0A426ZFC1_ENSVE|nr:hypothetical protein B296_00003369 [Ensete ventricosum]
MITPIVGIAWEVVDGRLRVAAIVEGQRGIKNIALIPSVRTPRDSKLGLTSVGDRPSLELFRGSSLLGSRP